MPQVPGLVNVDFADVRAIMADAGSSLMGQGTARGKDRAQQAALKVGLGGSSPGTSLELAHLDLTVCVQCVK